jgi:hypothetical protein
LQGFLAFQRLAAALVVTPDTERFSHLARIGVPFAWMALIVSAILVPLLLPP